MTNRIAGAAIAIAALLCAFAVLWRYLTTDIPPTTAQIVFGAGAVVLNDGAYALLLVVGVALKFGWVPYRKRPNHDAAAMMAADLASLTFRHAPTPREALEREVLDLVAGLPVFAVFFGPAYYDALFGAGTVAFLEGRVSGVRCVRKESLAPNDLNVVWAPLPESRNPWQPGDPGADQYEWHRLHAVGSDKPIWVRGPQLPSCSTPPSGVAWLRDAQDRGRVILPTTPQKH